MQKLNLWQFNSKSQKVVLCNRWHALHSERNSTAHGLNFRLSDRVTEACGRVCARSQGTQADPDPSMSFVDSLVTLLNCSNFVPQSGCQPIEPDWPDAIITVGVLLLAEKMGGPQRTRNCPISSNGAGSCQPSLRALRLGEALPAQKIPESTGLFGALTTFGCWASPPGYTKGVTGVRLGIGSKT